MMSDPVRVNGGMSLRNGMWHDLRNSIIMQNTRYAGNNLTEECAFCFRANFLRVPAFLMLWTPAEYNY